MSGSGRTNLLTNTPGLGVCAEEPTISRKARSGISLRPIATISTASCCSWPPATIGPVRLGFVALETPQNNTITSSCIRHLNDQEMNNSLGLRRISILDSHTE